MAHIHFSNPWHLPERLATSRTVFTNRRQVLKALGWGAVGLSLPRIARADVPAPATDLAKTDPAMTRPAVGTRFKDRFPAERNGKYLLPENLGLTPEEKAAAYNNFYEFTTAKDEVWKLAKDYPVDPWKVEIHGLVKKPKTLDLDDLFTRFPLEERLYRFRCVERWAMQVPWVGFPLKALVDFAEPLSTAKFVRFVTVMDPERMPGQKSQSWYPWPYVEALRMDEAVHELAFAAVGIYGHALPMQHGAPWRVVAPWKYGFKNAKSIVAVEFTAEPPITFWNDTQPDEYGFYGNVEPQKSHPRWSQRWEQDIGTGETRETLLYNGYKDLVGSLYTGREL